MKTICITLLAFVVVLGLSTGCNTTQTTGNGTDSTLVDTPYVDRESECGDLQPKTFCWMGLDFIKITDSLTWKQYPAPEGGVFKDTVFNDTVKSEAKEEVISWNVRMLRFASGTVFLESDFETGFLLNRIRIETPEYKTKSGLGVGSTAAEVLKAYEGEPLHVAPFEEFHVMEVIRPVMVGAIARSINFHFPLGDWYKPDQPEFKLTDIPADAKVSRIVVM